MFTKPLTRTSRLSSFYRISNHKNFIPKQLVNALTDLASGTSRTSRRLLEEKAPGTILEKECPVPKNTAASKIGNGVISLAYFYPPKIFHLFGFSG